jgi:hypothetical protein
MKRVLMGLFFDCPLKSSVDIFFSFSVLLIADHRVWAFEMSAPLSEGGYEAEAYCGDDARDSGQVT